MFCAGLSDPHPSLQLLLCIDVSAAVAVLSEMTCGWDAVETDLRAAAGKPTAELESVLVATQVVNPCVNPTSLALLLLTYCADERYLYFKKMQALVVLLPVRDC